jgi:methyl-accepting chemotaxis protein
LFKVLGQTTGAFTNILQPFLKLGQTIGFFKQGTFVLTKVIEFVVKAIAEVVNFVIEIIAKIASIFGKGDEVRKFKIELDPTTEAVSRFKVSVQGATEELDKTIFRFADGSEAVLEFATTTQSNARKIADAAAFFESIGLSANAAEKELRDFIAGLGGEELTEQVEEIAGGMDDFSESLSGLDKTAKEVTASLTNVPSGFRTALNRFESVDAALTAPGGGLEMFGEDLAIAATGDAPGTTIFNIGTIQANDPEEMVRMMKDGDEFERFAESGSSQESGGSFSSETRGA